ncbi:MAG: Lrp/AsnC ligand binding domain-containing protein [Terriglobia bacterium]
MRAYVFVSVTKDKSTDVAQRLPAIERVRYADVCWGQPEIIVLIEGATQEALQQLVFDKIRKTSGVDHTETHIALGS